MRLFLALAFMLSAPIISAQTLTISPYEGDGQTGQPGFPVEIPPVVRVTDSYGLPAAGHTVNFSILEGGGLVSGAVQTTNSQGLATVGGWALGTQPGVKKLQAALDGADGSPVVFTATAEAKTDVVVQLELEGPIIAGEPFLYELVITNNGPYTVDGVLVKTEHGAPILPNSIAWLCEAAPGSSSCGADNGSGPVMDFVDLPQMGEVAYIIASRVPINLSSGQATSRAKIELPAGFSLVQPESGADQATGEIQPNTKPIFQDSFEAD